MGDVVFQADGEITPDTVVVCQSVSAGACTDWVSVDVVEVESAGGAFPGLTVDQGIDIAEAVLVLFAIGFGIRVVRQQLWR